MEECFAIELGIHALRVYLLGCPFIIQMDRRTMFVSFSSSNTRWNVHEVMGMGRWMVYPVDQGEECMGPGHLLYGRLTLEIVPLALYGMVYTTFILL